VRANYNSRETRCTEKCTQNTSHPLIAVAAERHSFCRRIIPCRAKARPFAETRRVSASSAEQVLRTVVDRIGNDKQAYGTLYRSHRRELKAVLKRPFIVRKSFRISTREKPATSEYPIGFAS